ncbi:MAG: hypothetical protein N2376_12600 [Clostridia bacterium]|nr:hypothetical protein [Clostridia bacterium]
MKEKRITTLQVAGTYIGTIVGAGFASGQEMLQFFVRFGKMGLWGLLVVTLLFIFFGYIIMELGWLLQATSHLPIVHKVGGRIIGPFSDIVITFFLFGALTAMIAGSGALFSQEFKLHPLIGSLFMAVITVITVLGGFQGIISSISIVVPFLIITAVGVSIAALLNAPKQAVLSGSLGSPGFLRNWLWSAILYTSYNTVTASAILGPLGFKTRNKKVIRNGAILGGLGLGVGALAIFLALYVNAGRIRDLEVPMISVANSISPLIKIIYAVVLLAEIYTTAVGDLYGFAARLCEQRPRITVYVILAATAAAFIASLAGFSNLVRYLYPAVGYCGVLTLLCLIYDRYKVK